MNEAKTSTLITGVVAIIGAIATAAVMIIGALKETKEAVESASNTSAVTKKVQDEKLDNIHVLVNSRYSALLEELAFVRTMLAKETGNKSDELKADSAIRESENERN